MNNEAQQDPISDFVDRETRRLEDVRMSQPHAGMDANLNTSVVSMQRTAELDPHGKDQHAPGAKLDAGKVPILRGTFGQFPRALEHVARVSKHGAEKYTWNGWESVQDGIQRYTDAMGRHIAKEITEGPVDADSQELHAAQVAWNSLARLELMLREKSNGQ